MERYWPLLLVIGAALCGVARDPKAPPTRLTLFLIVVGLCAAAQSITGYLMKIHAPVRTQAQASEGDNIWADLCGGEDEDQEAGCEAVVTGKYGYVTIPWPTVVAGNSGQAGTAEATTKLVDYKIPVAQLGRCYYWFMLVWFLSTGVPRRTSRWWHLLPLSLSLASVVASVFFIYVMAAKLDQWCRLCLALHIIDFAVFPCVLLLWPFGSRRSEVAARPEAASVPDASDAPLRLSHVGVTLACVVVLSGSSFLGRHYQVQTAMALQRYAGLQKSYARVQKDTTFLLSAYAGTPAVEIPHRVTAPVQGDPQAEHELVMFSSLQCPACRKFEEWFRKEILEQWGGRIRITFRHFPLCTDCNPAQKGTPTRPSGVHPRACAAAYAVEAARMQAGARGFWSMHDLIFQRQKELSGAALDNSWFVTLAGELGLDTEQFAADLAGGEVRRAVDEDVQLGIALKVRATPTVFLDGKRLATIQRSDGSFWKALAVAAEKGSDHAKISQVRGAGATPGSPGPPGAR